MLKRLPLALATLCTTLALRAWVTNPGFEELTPDGTPASWSSWSRKEGCLSFNISRESHSGKHALRITHTGEQDFAFSNSRRMQVAPGESFHVTCWMKRINGANAGTLDIVGLHNKKIVTWRLGTAAAKQGDGWQLAQTWISIPDDVNTIYIRTVGSGPCDYLIDTITTKPGSFTLPPPNPRVAGWARSRPIEKMGRSAIAAPLAEGTLISWRLLDSDLPDIAFDLYRTTGNQRERINPSPIRQTTTFLDSSPPNQESRYSIKPVDSIAGVEEQAITLPLRPKLPYISIPLSSTNATAQKVGIGDLDGDGIFDYVIKHPRDNVDPWYKYWYASPETFKVEARRHDGTLLWIKDLGWNIERGIWYSPMLVADLNGNGRAEVALKIGDDTTDHRNSEGYVQQGPEWLAVLDGLTGREIARAPWPQREPFESYNLASRNQLALAYLDGKTPCLITLRGTYGVMIAEAWQLKDGKLEHLWRFSNEDYPSTYKGQGAHSCLCADLDGDGRDEILLGSLVLDDNGSVLWCSGRGHPDAHYLGDIDPQRPGLELAFFMETPQRGGGGIHVLDPATGNLLWQLDTPTHHVHGSGICSDIDVMHPGLELYGAEAVDHKLSEKRWLFTSDGKLLKEGTQIDMSFGVPTAWWDADLQREIVRSRRVSDYEGSPVSEGIEGHVVMIADLVGDWREEIITTLPGEVRIYTTPIPAMDRRICLMQDRLYRMRTTMNAMGYTQTPTLSYIPEATAPNLNLTLQKTDNQNLCRVVVVAPLNQSLQGTVTLTPPKGVTLETTTFNLNLAPGKRHAQHISLTGKAKRGELIQATLDLSHTRLHGSVPYW